MGLEWEPWQSLQKRRNQCQTQMLVKLLVFALIGGLSFCLLFSPSSPFFPFSHPPPTIAAVLESNTDIPLEQKPNASNIGIPQIPTVIDDQDSRKESCDIFSGKWIPNPLGPTYTSVSCPFIEDPQNCMKNGRPDTEYLYWRWKPHDCDLPPLDAKKFLQAMRDKSWAFIGDSILRNHAQSLICLLSQAESPIEVDHDKDYKSRTWRFSSFNFTLSMVWAPFLVKADIFENDEGVSTSEIQLHLNTLNPKWTRQYNSHDYVLFSFGQWFFKTAVYWEDNKVIGCFRCPRLNLTEVEVGYAYHKSLQLVFEFVTKSEHKPLVFYKTWTPDHFEYGEWSTGGVCNRTQPYREGEYDGKSMDLPMHRIELEEFYKATGNGSEGRGNMKLLDTYRLSLLRPDAHPGPYRSFHPFDKDKNAKVQNDCLHWCLPGPIDTWNDLLMKMVVKS